jgi:acetyl esterase/lipase
MTPTVQAHWWRGRISNLMQKSCLMPVKALVLAVVSVFAQPAHAEPPSADIDPALGLSTIPLWGQGAPGALGNEYEDLPTLTVFRPQHGRSNGAAVVIAPGGGYQGRTSNLEGRQVADWYNARGFTAFVLKYRLGAKYLYPIPLTDATRSIRVARSLAEKYNLDLTRIGMTGFSAGGHLAAMVGNSCDDGNAGSKDLIERFSSRPDFLVLGYPWLNAMQPSVRDGIPFYQAIMKLPEARYPEFVNYTPLFHVTSRTPPTFIFITSDDATVSVQSSVDYYSALRAAGVAAELHIFAHGAHGVGLGSGDPALDLWPTLLDAWLRGRQILR